jgi:putative DNA primase/helicase
MNNDELPLYQFDNGLVITDKEASDKMYRIVELEPENDWEYSLDDKGMAQLFSDLYGDDTKYCPEYKTWYTYHDGAWRKDVGSLLVSGKLKQFIKLLSLYVYEIDDKEKQKKWFTYIIKAGDQRVRSRILKDAETDMRVNAYEFDNHPNLINCKNGTFDLKEQKFYEPKQEDKLTMQTAFNFTEGFQDKKCERWERFIEEITEGDKDKAEYLQKTLGYSILGSSKEECMFILYGKTTRNGKSTLLNTIQHLLGDYATVAPVELICRSTRQKDPNAASPVLAKLKGKRFVTMSENENSGKLDESTIKQYTGGEEITARGLYEQAVTFMPQFKIWLSCNDLPAVRDKSLFASERIKVIEFTRHFKDEEQDKELKAYFETPEAMTGIFSWLVAGYDKYIREGMKMSAEMQKVVKQYEKDNDLILQFLEDRCQRDDNSEVLGKTLYDCFKSWCRTNGYYSCSNKKFHAEVTAHPEWYKEKLIRRNVPVYTGVKIV